jgi:hypothetical protein
MAGENFPTLVASAKRAAAALRDGKVPFLLAGGLASWARGDVDLIVRPEDAERALTVLEEAGMKTERPPEGWLYKAWDGDVLIDIIFSPTGNEVDDALFERGDEMEVEATKMRVLSAEDLLISKLMAITEHHLDFDRVLELTRALREQIDWSSVRRRTEADRLFVCSPPPRVVAVRQGLHGPRRGARPGARLNVGPGRLPGCGVTTPGGGGRKAHGAVLRDH